MKYFMGIDMGTQGTRIGVFDEEIGEEEIECVYTVVRDTAAYDPLMDEYAKCMQWVSKNNIRLDKYCYIRPLLVSHLGKCTESFLEVFAPIIK